MGTGIGTEWRLGGNRKNVPSCKNKDQEWGIWPTPSCPFPIHIYSIGKSSVQESDKYLKASMYALQIFKILGMDHFWNPVALILLFTCSNNTHIFKTNHPVAALLFQQAINERKTNELIESFAFSQVKFHLLNWQKISMFFNANKAVKQRFVTSRKKHKIYFVYEIF